MAPDEALEIVQAQAGTGLCPAAVRGLEAALAGDVGWQATVTSITVDEGHGPALRRPA
jgi:hypothetical protein